MNLLHRGVSELGFLLANDRNRKREGNESSASVEIIFTADGIDYFCNQQLVSKTENPLLRGLYT